MSRTCKMRIHTEQTVLSTHLTTGEKEAITHAVLLEEDLCPRLQHVSGRIIQPAQKTPKFY